MSMQFEVTSGASIPEDIQRIIAEEAARRPQAEVPAGLGPVATAIGSIGASKARDVIHQNLGREIDREFAEIRSNPELQAKNMDQMVRTVEKYLEQGNNPIEYWEPNNQGFYALGRNLNTGEDTLYYDPTAPHAAIMAHELGHAQMWESNDPLSLLQRTGLGKFSGNNAPAIGALGATAGYALGGKNRALGTALGGLAGVVGGSGNFAYELGGASGRALGYLPDDVDQEDAVGDLVRAGMTYGMAGPGRAAVAALAAGAGANLLGNETVRRKAGELLEQYLSPKRRL